MPSLNTAFYVLRPVILFAFFFAGCTLTTSKTIEVKFKNGVESIQEGIESKITCEHINVIGTKTTVDGKTERMMEISILNAAYLPRNNDSLWSLAQTIAFEFKDNLVNRGEFGIYKIYFVTQSDKASVKSNYYEEIIFTDKELR